MEGPVEISFKNVEKTTQLENLINKKIAKLEKICSHMISCRVMVERLQKSQATGNPYCVRIDMTVPPTHELIAKQTASKSNMHDPLQTVINKTFEVAERRLKELTDRQHGIVKTHPQQQVMGIVHRLFADQDYGFIKTVDTFEDVYFHKNSVLHGDYDRLTVGTGIRFALEQGKKGLQASSVEIIYKSGTGISAKSD